MKGLDQHKNQIGDARRTALLRALLTNKIFKITVIVSNKISVVGANAVISSLVANTSFTTLVGMEQNNRFWSKNDANGSFQLLCFDNS